MPEFTKMTDRDVLKELVRHRAIAEHCANELMRRASENNHETR